MVRLYVSASLLALALATGSTLAFSDEYQRELDSNLYRREFVDSQEIPFTREDHEDLYGREVQVFDDLEAREPQGLLGAVFRVATKIGSGVAKKAGKKAAEHAVDHHRKKNGGSGRRHTRRHLAFEHDEELFGRGLDAEDFLGREYKLDERDIFDDLD